MIRSGSTYEMYYYALKKPGVLHATSPDGLVWRRQSVVISKGTPGSWNEQEASSPSVLVAQAREWLSFTGGRCSLEGNRAMPYCDMNNLFLDIRIGVATRPEP